MEGQFRSGGTTPTDVLTGPTSRSTVGVLDYEGPDFTNRELFVLRTIAIVAASISLTSGLLVGYWFIRMKRSFRHQYVFLLQVV